ncbi:MAG: DUF2332 family protein [Pseudomonadota bacterium]
MTQENIVREAFARQARGCRRLGSPFTATLMEGLGSRLDRSTATGQRILDWQARPDAEGDAVPLRLAGALHALVRSGQLPTLAPLYPPAPVPEPAILAEAALAAIVDEDAQIAAWLDHAPQTNEVARSAALYAGLMVVAAETGLPLTLFELGASAGLNLILDRYAYRLGGRETGAPVSPLCLCPDWTGSAPPESDVRIGARHGCDLNPLDVTDPAQTNRLAAFIWPDQLTRIARFEAAVELARPDPPRIDKADAAIWVEARMGAPAAPGAARVVMHSIAYQYFPPATKARIEAAMAGAGAAATAEAPLAWLALEIAEDAGQPLLTLRLWPGGEPRVLAEADPHLRTLAWRGS